MEKKPTNVEKQGQGPTSAMHPSMIGALAEELAKRLPNILRRPQKKNGHKNKVKKIEDGIFLDTSAIIDGRIFDVIHTGLLTSHIVIPSSILLELKHIADSQNTVKRERGQNGLTYLEKLKKTKGIKLIVMSEDDEKKYTKDKIHEVDERLIALTKYHKGRIITCDYNLEKKASIQGVKAINMNALAQCLKISAVPGEALHVAVLHTGKDSTQGVGYLDDGTMIVVEQGSMDVSRKVDVVVSRVIQTSAGKILFAKKI